MARTCGELPRSRCERDYNDETETFEPGGCEGSATETVKDTENTPRRFCATHAVEARRLNWMLFGIMCGDADARRFSEWINASPDRAEYDRRVSFLPQRSAR